ncbi:hypothetical protein ZWY2020_019576 [Hordeum vulgare]|nr:hypothetical protein ZWY2020_019576 [Hordeum vulgare]
MLSLAWTRRAVVEVEAPPTPTPTPTWGGCSLHGLDIEVVREKDAVPGGGGSGLVALAIPSYFSGPRLAKRQDGGFPLYTGYSAARSLVGKGAMTDLRRLSREAEDMLAELFASIDGGGGGAPNKNKEDAVRARPRVVQLRLSPELALWKSTQHAIGNMLPTKGAGLIQATPQVLALLGATDWPEAMKTTNALSGSGMANLLIGASDVRTLFSNYVVDMAFYYEHGYHKAFPSFSRLLHDGIADARSLRTPGGRQRREAVAIGASYIRAKIALEAAHKTLLKDRSAQMDRRAAQVISLCESSILGMGAEAIARGFDVGAVTSDLVFSSPGTDVIDVGSDLVNSEVMNSFLNVADIAASGVVSEPALRAIYDAYAATGARMYTQRWHEPVAGCASPCTLGTCTTAHVPPRPPWMAQGPQVPAQPQRGRLDEVFDTDFRTTASAGPLTLSTRAAKKPATTSALPQSKTKRPRTSCRLWSSIVTGPLEYVRKARWTSSVKTPH